MKERLVNISKIIFIVTLTIAYLFLSIEDLDKDVINPDGINWHTRTQAFNQALVDEEYEKTFQAYHPGTTLMWLSGPIAQMSADTSKGTFLSRDYHAKLSLVVFETLVLLVCLAVLWRVAGFYYMAGFGLFVALEPFTVGMRRLYHLDYLMAITLFQAFLLLIYFNYKAARWFLIPLAGLFFTFSLLTKSVAVTLLPAAPFIFLLGNSKWHTKLLGFVGFLLCSILFLYVLFPPIWKDPIKSTPKYFQKIANGITEIGVEGKKELGSSGRSDNITLDEAVDSGATNFYLASLVMRLSPAGVVLLLISAGFYAYTLLKGWLVANWRFLKSLMTRKIQTTFIYSPASWLCFWSLSFSAASLVALTLSTKKSDRYEILVFPFLFTFVAYLFSRLKFYLAIPLVACYAVLVGQILWATHPYYLAYSNQYLGGLEVRLRTLDGAPFGIGIYEAFNIVRSDLVKNGNFGYYTIAGSKSVKALSVGGRFSRVPSCVTDYIILFAFDDKPSYMCRQRYVLLDTVKIDGFDYWYVYKRLNQKHESNYE